MCSLIVKGPKGLGDAIYLNPILNYLKEQNKDKSLTVINEYPEIFESVGVSVVKQANKADIYASYVNLKDHGGSQFYDMCRNAQIPFLDMSKWFYTNLSPSRKTIDFVLKNKKYDVIVSPYSESIKSDVSLVPDIDFFSKLVEKESKNKRVLVGKRKYYDLSCSIDRDVVGKTSIHDLLFLICNAQKTIGQVGFIIPASEVFETECLAVFSRNYKKTNSVFVKTITPKKVITKPTTKCIYDDERI